MTDSADPWAALLMALGFMLVLEGLLPFVSPRQWRQLFEQAARLSDGQLRFLGLAALVAGAAIVAVALG